MSDSDICSYIIACFDKNSKKYHSSNPIDALRSFVMTPNGKEQLTDFLLNEHELSPYVLALIGDKSFCSRNNDTIKMIDSFLASLQLKPIYHNMFKTLMDGTSTLSFQIILSLPENKENLNGVIRKDWFEEQHTNKTPPSKRKKFGIGKLSPSELRAYMLHLCLLVETNNDSNLLTSLWGFKNIKTAQRRKDELKKKFMFIKKKYESNQQKRQTPIQNRRLQSQRTPGGLFSPSIQEPGPKKTKSSNSPFNSIKIMFSPKKTNNSRMNTGNAVNALNLDLQHGKYNNHYNCLIHPSAHSL